MADRKKNEQERPYARLSKEAKKRVIEDVKAYLDLPQVKLARRLGKQLQQKLNEFYFGEDDPTKLVQ